MVVANATRYIKNVGFTGVGGDHIYIYTYTYSTKHKSVLKAQACTSRLSPLIWLELGFN